MRPDAAELDEIVPPFRLNVPIPKTEFDRTPLAAVPLEVKKTSPLLRTNPPENVFVLLFMYICPVPFFTNPPVPVIAAPLVKLVLLPPAVSVLPCRLIKLPKIALRPPTVSLPPSLKIALAETVKLAVSERISLAPVVRVPTVTAVPPL